MRFASLYYNKYLCAHYKRFAPAAQLSKHTKRELHEAVPTCETLILLCVGGDAYIAPAKCTRFYGNLRRIRYFPWVDVGIDPYGPDKDIVGILFDKFIDGLTEAIQGLLVVLLDGVDDAVLDMVLQNHLADIIDGRAHGGDLD